MYLAEKMHRWDVEQFSKEIKWRDFRRWQLWFHMGGNYLDDVRHAQLLAAIYGSQGAKCTTEEFMISKQHEPKKNKIIANLSFG